MPVSIIVAHFVVVLLVLIFVGFIVWGCIVDKEFRDDAIGAAVVLALIALLFGGVFSVITIVRYHNQPTCTGNVCEITRTLPVEAP